LKQNLFPFKSLFSVALSVIKICPVISWYLKLTILSFLHTTIEIWKHDCFLKISLWTELKMYLFIWVTNVSQRKYRSDISVAAVESLCCSNMLF
jgi:hypothetical protein